MSQKMLAGVGQAAGMDSSQETRLLESRFFYS